ncbi:MAG: GAP family protein [Pirellula sp.]|nr:GAP family protein [Pirellula sp.]
MVLNLPILQDPALFELLAASLAIALNPPAVVAVILMLSSSHAERKALSFLAGWMMGLFLVGAIALFAGELSGNWGPPERLTLIIQLVLGVVLIAFAVKKWRDHRAAAPSEEMPSWMRPIVGFSSAQAFGVAAAFAAFNPKTLAINVASVTLIVDAGLPTAGEWVALVLFVVVSSTTVAAPILYHFVAPRNSQAVLESLKNWLIVNNATVTAAMLVFLGVVLLWAGGKTLIGGT